MAPSDTEDEDLRAALAMSLNDAAFSHNQNISASILSTSVPAAVDSSAPSKSNVGFAALDRKAMEEERLARLKRKREGDISPPPQSSRKAPKVEASTVALPSGARLTTFSSLVNQDQVQRKSAAARAANENLKREPTEAVQASGHESATTCKSEIHANGARTVLAYPNGIVKKTWAFKFDRDGKDVKLEEVLEPLTLQTAVLSAFQWDIDWVMTKLRTPVNGRGATKCVLVMQAKEEAYKQEMLQQTENYRSFLRLCFPSMEGQVNCMHSKLMLLFHVNKLRIAVPTANLLAFDWGETGTMENSVFMIDLPRRPDGIKLEEGSLPRFGQELLFFLRKQGLEQDILDGVLNFDFKATEGMAFVHTVGGANHQEDAERTGLLGLAQSVRHLQLTTSESLQLDFAASSIGSLNDKFLLNVHSAARGEDMTVRAASSAAKSKEDFFKASSAKTPATVTPVRERLRIYFPTHSTVTSSLAGAAGTICLSRKYFEAGTFPRSCFRDYQSNRKGLVSHNKILYARGVQPEKSGSTSKPQNAAWVYVGSANLSESAWGALVFDRKTKAWKLNCRNWECGVLLPVPAEKLAPPSLPEKAVVKKEHNGEDSETDGEDEVGSVAKKARIEGEDSETESEDETGGTKVTAESPPLIDMSVFDEIVPPPFEYPGRRYGTMQPWYFMEY